MIKNKSISLIIPCRNEAQSLKKLLPSVPSFVDEIIIVDNHSKDETVTIAKKHKARVVKENRQIDNAGYGYAHQRGLREAKGDFVVAMDGDETYPAKPIKKIIEFIVKNNLDLVSCNRLPLKRSNAISFLRKLGISILNLETNLLYGYPVKDILSGMWVIRKEKLGKMNFLEGGWNFSVEIKLEAITNKDINYAEFHIDHLKRIHGESKLKIWREGFNYFNYILFKRAKELKQNTVLVLKRFFRFGFQYAPSAIASLAFIIFASFLDSLFKDR